jgi:NAD(P)-dependent dehydrogenase (short-subunit alcohol dehydrogenase family)
MSGAQLQDRVVVLVGVGAPGAIPSNGRATALAFAKAGAELVLLDSSAEALAACEIDLSGANARSTSIVCDVTQEDSVQSAVAQALAIRGHVDVLHFNVGMAKPGRLPRATTEDFDRMFAVNVRSAFWFSRLLLPSMERAGRGVITHVSSVSSIRHLGIPTPFYDMSKAALNALSRHIAVEYGSKGIRANSLLLGMMDTPLARSAIEGAGKSVEPIYDQYLVKVPSGRMGTANDTAGAAVFLASDAASYINGVELVVDGGLTLRTA